MKDKIRYEKFIYTLIWNKGSSSSMYYEDGVETFYNKEEAEKRMAAWKRVGYSCRLKKERYETFA